MKLRNKISLIFLVLSVVLIGRFGKVQAQVTGEPVRMVVIGMTHGHVPWILDLKGRTDLKVVGYYEPNREMALRYAKRYGFDPSLIYDDLGKMLDEVKPEAAVAFGSIAAHLEAVEACAPRKIHVMVEKPLATNLKDALRMEALAHKHQIHLLTNYETSWYPTTVKSYELVNDSSAIGKIRKVVVHDGHQGPKEIGVNAEFFAWLTDPMLNGGGALIDFGCYGANLMTYLMKGEQPVSVTAVTRQYKPEIYPRVDDDATIIVDYRDAQCLIQASWNWPMNRKDMEIYGELGYVYALNNSDMVVKKGGVRSEWSGKVTPQQIAVYTDPFAYFTDVIRDKIKVPQNGLYSLPTNLTVVRILEAARESAKTGKRVLLNP